MATFSQFFMAGNFARADLTEARVRASTIPGAFGPDDLELLQAAFDLAWQNLADTVDENSRAITREKLAAIVISSAHPSQANSSELAQMAIRSFTTATFQSEPNVEDSRQPQSSMSP
jgi:hypothetical protein